MILRVGRIQYPNKNIEEKTETMSNFSSSTFNIKGKNVSRCLVANMINEIINRVVNQRTILIDLLVRLLFILEVM